MIINKKVWIVGLLLITVATYAIIAATPSSKDIDENIKSQYSYENMRSIYESEGEVTSYIRKLLVWETEGLDFTDNTVSISASDVISPSKTLAAGNLDYDSDSVEGLEGEYIEYEFYVPTEGLYTMNIDYYILTDGILAPEINILVNNETQYFESERVIFQTIWKRVQREEEFRYDRFNDEMLPHNEYLGTWQNMDVYDSGYFHSEPLRFHFNEGVNTLKLEVLNNDLAFGNITLSGMKTYHDYDEYNNLNSNQSSNSSGELIVLNAEEYTYKNTLNIKATSTSSPSVTPYKFNQQLLNTIDGYSFDDGGTALTYEFEVEKDGFYNIGLKYRQNFKVDLPSSRRILVDNQLLFDELDKYDFHYTKDWKNEILGNDDGDFEIYLEKGVHTLTFVVNPSDIGVIKEDIKDIMNEITILSLEILKLTGGKTDQYRTWDIETYIPTIKDELNILADRVAYNYYAINLLNGDDTTFSTETYTLQIAEQLLRELAEDPESIPTNMTKLSEGSGSALQLIGVIIPTIVEHPIDLDTIYIFNDAELPKENVNFFVKMWEGVKSFFYSFVDPRYKYEEDEESIKVWVQKSKGYTDIMQQMIDEEFTSETGIKVELSLLRDEQKLILANSSGDLPHAAINITSGLPYQLALREVLVDYRELSGFEEAAEPFNDQIFMPFIYDDGVYAMPESLGATLLFYRTDIFRDLGLEVPTNWDEVIELLPLLQSYGMNFYHPIGNVNAYKGYNLTAPIIYQHNGDLISTDARSTLIDTEESIEAMKFMTDLFTVYGMPLQVSSFYQHFRSGTLPIGIGDMNMYLRFKYAAPELSGQWGVALVPGIYDEENDVINRHVSNQATGNVIFKNDDGKKIDESWKFIEWWTSTDTQAKFTYNVQSTLGETYLYMSANEEAFEMSAWPNDTKQMVLEQWEWLKLPPNSPGNYMIEREISNIWNRVVFNNVHVRTAIDDAIPIINRELERKLTEFGYLENSVVVIEYVIPNHEEIKKLLKEK